MLELANRVLDIAFSGVLQFIGMIVLLVVCWFFVFDMIFRIFNRVLRSINIALRGWPSSDVDADGDFHPNDRS